MSSDRGTGRRKASSVVAALLLIAALVGVAAWLMQGAGDTEAREDASAALGDLPAAAPATLPGSEAESEALGEDAAARDAASPGDAPALPGEAVSFTGRVLDTSGRPVPGAVVVHLPSWTHGEAAGLSGAAVGWRTLWDRFERATTDALGRFTLPTRESRAPGGAIVDAHGGHSFSYGSGAGQLPRLLVQHAVLETKLFTVWAWSRGAGEVGDLVVGPGSSVTGRLVDDAGQPVAGAVLSLSRSDDPAPPMADWQTLWELPRTTSAADGRFALDGLWAVKLTVDATAEGFVPWRSELTLRAGDVRDLGDVVLDRGGEVSGWVTRASGAPVQGAEIVLRREGLTYTEGPDAAAVESAMQMWYGGTVYELHATSAADGSFRFRGVRTSHDWRAAARKDGCEPAQVAGVKPGGEPLRIVLQDPARLLLRVVDPESRQPIADARVEAHRIGRYGPSPWPLKLPVTPEGDGWLLVGAGSVLNQATVSAPGRATQSFDLPGVELGAQAESTVELPRESLLAGRVVDGQGAPVARARVRCQRLEEEEVETPAASQLTDADGRFAFPALAAGDWSLVASAAGFVPAPAFARTLAAAERLADMELPLARSGQIAGRLLGRDAARLGGYHVSAQPEAAEGAPAFTAAPTWTMKGASAAAPPQATITSWKGLVDDRGEYLIDGVPAGDYRVNCFPGAEGMTHVTAGEVARLDLVLRERPRLSGRVTAAGRPIADAEVHVTTQHSDLGVGDARVLRTDASGLYVVDFEGEGKNHGAEVSARWQQARTRAVHIDPQWDREEVVDLAFGSGAVAGEVVDEAGAPLAAEARFLAAAREGFGPTDKVVTAATAGADGRFRVEWLPAATGTLTVKKDPYVAVTLKDVEVREGETTSVPRLVLRMGGSLDFRAGGERDANDWTKRFRVEIRSLVEPGWETAGDVRHGQSKVFAGIPAGEVEIEISRPGEGGKREIVRTVQAVIEGGGTLVLDQPVAP